MGSRRQQRVPASSGQPGSGITELDAGLRLRYEITRQFAPYLGVSYEGKFGQTATFARQGGESAGDVRVVLGLRAWF